MEPNPFTTCVASSFADAGSGCNYTKLHYCRCSSLLLKNANANNPPLVDQDTEPLQANKPELLKETMTRHRIDEEIK